VIEMERERERESEEERGMRCVFHMNVEREMAKRKTTWLLVDFAFFFPTEFSSTHSLTWDFLHCQRCSKNCSAPTITATTATTT
jgi:hypothetical protein